MNTDVSVVIPVYNAADYLPEALESVLAQDEMPAEIVVVDDGSTDSTPRVMSRYGPPIRYLRQTNQGVAVARNRGIRESRAQLVAFLDADDIWLPAKVSRQLSALAAEPNSRVCHSAFQAVSATGTPQGVVRYRGVDSMLHELLLKGNVVGTPSSVMADRTVLLRSGGFDPALSLCADWDLWIRLACITPFCYVDEPLVRYRRHESNMSRDVELLEQDSVKVLEKAFSTNDLSIQERSLRGAAFAFNYSVLAGSYLYARRHADAWRCLWEAVRRRPLEALRALALPWRLARRAWRASRPRQQGLG